MQDRINTFLVMLVTWAISTTASWAASQEGSEGRIEQYDFSSRSGELRLKVLAYGGWQELSDSPINPENRLGIPTSIAEIDIRPDFFINLDDKVSISAKPRTEIYKRWWDEGGQGDRESTQSNFFFNELTATMRFNNELFLTVGRENVQWGPSYLLSPSNPFIKDNGRSSPKREVPGLDYFRAVWLPSYEWTASLIANVDSGRLGKNPPFGSSTFSQSQEFEKTYTLKVDYTDFGRFGSLIASYREDGSSALGFFAASNVSDAVLVYGEGQVSDDTDKPLLLVGASYTLPSGGTFVGEYYYNGDGCSGNPTSCLGTVGTGNPFLGRNYLLLQYTQTNLGNQADITLQGAANLDDGSSRFIGVYEHNLGNHAQAFAIATVTSGDEQDEFSSIVDYSVTAGIEFTF